MLPKKYKQEEKRTFMLRSVFFVKNYSVLKLRRKTPGSSQQRVVTIRTLLPCSVPLVTCLMALVPSHARPMATGQVFLDTATSMKVSTKIRMPASALLEKKIMPARPWESSSRRAWRALFLLQLRMRGHSLFHFTTSRIKTCLF